MAEETPTLEERVGWLEDRMDAIEKEVAVAKRVLTHVNTADGMIFNGLISFLVKEKILDRQKLTSYLQTQIELGELDEEHAEIKRFVTSRIDGLMTEELDELHGLDLDDFRRNVLRDLHSGQDPNEQTPDDDE